MKMKLKKISKLKIGDEAIIISLSSGILGEPYCKHQIEIGLKRLVNFGLKPKFAPNSLMGIKYLSENPNARAEDLLFSLKDKKSKIILSAIGGNDTYKTIPFIMDNKENIQLIKRTNKIFMGYSDTTINHLMFNKLGVPTFYGQSFLTDLAELDKDMLIYSKNAFKSLFKNGKITFKPSNNWFHERMTFDANQINTPRNSNIETKGFMLLQGKQKISGILMGGCLESIADLINDSDKNLVNKKYNLFTDKTNFKNKVLLLETSESKSSPENILKMLVTLSSTGCFKKIKGVIIGKPQDEIYFNEYEEVFKSFFKNFPNLTVVYNLNIGHSYPKMILKLLSRITINVKTQKIINYKN